MNVAGFDLFRMVVDVALLTFLLYRLFVVMRGTYVRQVVVGLIVLMAGTLAVRAAQLPASAWLLEHFWGVALVLLAIIFQPELRTALARLGSHPMGKIFMPDPLSFIEELIGAVREAMQRQMGMLLVLEQDVGLQNYAETGTRINGELSKELLLAIFHYRSPLHDGAAILQADRLSAVGCLLPLSNDPTLAKILGTRHRAAVGLSEYTDAWVIVVSEETGTLSLAQGGRLERELTPEDLRDRLIALYERRLNGGRQVASPPAPASPEVPPS